MKYFRYWIEAKHRIRIFDRSEEINLLVGSNVSKEDAQQEALLRAKKIEDRIASGAPKDEYEAGIKEHVAEVIDDSNVVTVCRYGAKILNTSQYSVLDLDDYPESIWDMFKSVRKLGKKEKIVYKFEESIRRFPQLGTDFRIYETAKGIRIIGSKYIDPADPGNRRLLRKLNIDWLYLVLSSKQQCYRARLTPKPYRMRIKTIRVRTPLACETEAYQSWAQMYGEASRAYSVVRLIKTLGQDFSNDRVIKFHDAQCNAHKDLKLA
ncbi:MAG TPA: hypothetical protein DCZ13_13460 [Porticoccaceae bacterium]|nr:hypothetical protein [Porticoccaceae bacterium]